MTSSDHLEEYCVGDRVQVSSDYHWAKLASGTIGIVPEEVADLEPSWEGHSRNVEMVHGVEIFYWVTFDSPQVDEYGDGPFNGAEIESRCLILLERSKDAG